MSLTIRSNHTGARLTVTPDGRDYWQADLELPGLSARTRVYEPSYNPVSHFFRGMADSWRGWDGERSWASLDGELALAATHDGLGTVSLRVELRTDLLGESGWRAEGILHLDAGGLDRVAREAKALGS